MKIVHFSDLHGGIPYILPKADVYVCTGDIFPNFLFYLYRTPDGRRIRQQTNLHLIGSGNDETEPWGATLFGREIVPDVESNCQQEWIKRKSFRAIFGSPNAPVVCIRGNHDFTELAPLFGGEVYEIGEFATEFELAGLRWGGVRGVNTFLNEWSDELPANVFEERVRGLSDEIDVLITHSPPDGILDMFDCNLGSAALMSYINRRNIVGNPLKAHLFGHIHESCGSTKIGGTLFSNAATGWMSYELD